MSVKENTHTDNGDKLENGGKRGEKKRCNKKEYVKRK